MEAFDFYNGKYVLTCRNKCNFKYYFLEICIVNRAEISCVINVFKNCLLKIQNMPWKGVSVHVLP